MAEGVEFSRSIEDGSDVVFEFECTPCAADGSRVEGLQFCQTCNQFLCDTCTKYHKRFTKGHQLAPAGSTKHQKPTTTKPNKSVADLPKCRIHPDRDIEMYCGTHDMVYCLLCIANDHRPCEYVEEVKNGVHKPSASVLQQLVADIDRVNTNLQDAKDEKVHNVKMLKTNKIHLLKKIKKLRKEMNEHLDHLEQKTKAELDLEIVKLDHKLHIDITTANDLLTTINDWKADLACNADDKRMFIAEKLCRIDLSATKKYLTKANLFKQEVVWFARNSPLNDCIKEADGLGGFVRTSFTSQRSKYIVESSSERNVRSSTEKSVCCISGMCQLQDGTVLIVDRNNKKLKRLDDQLNVKDLCNINSAPLGLCAISPSEVVVRCTESLQFIHVCRSLSPGKVEAIKRLGGSIGNSIAFCDNNLWILVKECIHVYSSSGKLVKTIEKDSRGQKIFHHNYPASISVDNDGSKVYVAALEERVVVFNKNGYVIQEIHDNRLVGALGMCITWDDIVLVAGCNSNNVVMFDRNGHSIGEVVTSKDMLSFPRALCYDRIKSRLLVGFVAGNIQIYKLSK